MNGLRRSRGPAELPLSGSPTRLLLAREVLLGDALNDLPPLVHAIHELRLQIDEALTKVRELTYRAQLFRAIGEKVWIVND